jgi:prepilin-type processing-associated H-X9-DG protein
VNYGNTTDANSVQRLSIPDPYNAKNTLQFGGAPLSNMLVQNISSATQGGVIGLQQIIDGTSITLMAGEVLQGQGGVSGVVVNGATHRDARGLTVWGDAAGFETSLGPNSTFPDVIASSSNCVYPYPLNPPCTVETSTLLPMYGARSRHPGGLNVAMCDGQLQFIKNSIALPVWRALSTTQGNEGVGSDAY